MLIDLIKNDALINPYLCYECAENDIGIDIDKTIKSTDLVIIKVDSFYNATIHSNDRPKSPDCLIIQQCSDNNYILYIVELKNINSQDGFKVVDIVEKFKTCLEDFIFDRFGHYFRNPTFEYSNIKLYFISDPYGFKQNPEKQMKMRGHKLDALIAVRIPKLFGRHMYIEPHLPNPKINNCSYL